MPRLKVAAKTEGGSQASGALQGYCCWAISSSIDFCAGVSLLGKFISVREPNIKYLGLENMVRLAEVPACC